MASERLIDLSAIDLDAVVHDREGIARYNPHRGVMALLDAIVWHDESLDHGVAVVHVREDAFWTAGHIPGHPLMPGVLMVEAAAQLASFLYYKRSGKLWFAGFTRIEETSFRGQVSPGSTMYLLCRCLKYQLRRFVCQTQGVVDGQIVFESKITGMAFPRMGDVERVPLTDPAAGAAAR